MIMIKAIMSQARRCFFFCVCTEYGTTRVEQKTTTLKMLQSQDICTSFAIHAFAFFLCRYLPLVAYSLLNR